MGHIVNTLYTAFDFLFVLSVLVVAHEWGHYIAAKLFKMRVEEFSLFFGKRLIRLGVRQGTEYNIRAVPLGGFVRIAGMDPSDLFDAAPVLPADPTDHANPPALHGLSASDLASLDKEQISPKVRAAVEQAIDEEHMLSEEGRKNLEALLLSPNLNDQERRYLEMVLAARPDPASYSQKPIWQRALVIFAGPFMSLFFGYLLFCILGFTVGLPDPTSAVRTNVVEAVIKDTPAEKAGMKAGDKIVAIDGTPISNGNQMVDIIRNSAGKPLHLLIERGKTTLPLTVTPQAHLVPGKNGKQERIGLIGIQVALQTRVLRYTPLGAIKRGTVITFLSIRLMLSSIFSRDVRKNIGGPIAIADQIHVAQQEGPLYVALVAAELSISLGIVNLFPIPVLDGGHLLLLGIERIRRRRLTTREIYKAQYVGLAIIGTLFLLVMWNDILRLLPHGTK